MLRPDRPIRLVLYEWCMAGGFAGGDASIAREGRMMLEALAADAAKDTALEVTVLVEAGRALDLPSRTRLLAVPAGGAAAAIVAAARDADWTVVVAPETDGILARVVRAARAAGGHVLAPDDHVIGVASDKQATVDTLAARGVPVPAGRALAAGEPLPAAFHRPAVRKARAGCGGDGLEILAAQDAPPASLPTRIEALAEGTPVGVACLCGPSTTIVLPPMRQWFTAGDAPRYQGSDLLAGAGPIARATALARHAATALGATAGWLGVDMILGTRPDGRDDRVLEVNPRVTTSFVGLAQLFASSLVTAMIEAATGADAAPTLVPVVGSRPSADFRLPDA